MRKLKLLTAILLGMVLVFSVFGCGKSAKKDTIKVGINIELSGPVAEYGTKACNGAKLAIDDVNKEGGVLGKQIEAIVLDDKSDNGESASVAARLAQSGIVGYIGPATTGVTLAAVPVSEKYKLPIVTPTATAAGVTVDPKTGLRPYVFRVCFLDPFQGQAMAKYASTDLKAKKAAVLVDSSNDYSKGLAEAFKTNFTNAGGTIVANEAYTTKDKDFQATLTKIKAAAPDVIFVPGYYNEVGLIVKQGRELGITVPILGGDGWGSPQLVQIAGAQALNNTYFCNAFSLSNTDSKVQNFIKEYKAKYNVEPDAFAAQGYDAALMMMDAIKRAGSPDSAKITEALASTKDLQGICGPITIDKNHNPVKSAFLITFDNGKEVVKQSIQP